MVALNEADIRRSIEAGSLARGRQVHARGLVIDVDVNSGETVITGRVRGSEPKPYRQVITLRAEARGTAIHGVCSCPMTINCKHVAAVLIEALQSARVGENASKCNAPEQDDKRRSLLSPGLMGWLDDLEAAATGEGKDEYPADVKHRLIYMLAVETASTGRAARATISPVTATLLKAGGFGASPKFYNPNNIYNYQPAKYLRPVDMEILRELAWLARQNAGSLGHCIALTGEPSPAKLLCKILDTGRCRHGDVHGPVLREGRARPASARWLLQQNGRQRLIFEAAEDDSAARPFEIVLPIAPPYYVDMEAGLVGPIACNLPDRMAQRLAAAPEVAPVEAAAFAGVLEHRLAAKGLGGRLPLPSAPLKTETRHVKPAPRLHLFLADARLKLNYSWYSRDERHQGRFPLPLARLSFDYGGEIVPVGAPDDMVQRLADGELVLIPRDRKAEDAAFKRLEKADLRDVKNTPLDVHKEHEGSLFISPSCPSNPYEFLAKFDDHNRFLAFSAERVPELVSAGWQIDYSEDYPYRIAEGEAAWWADIGEGSGIDWFSFELGVEFEGHRVNLIPHLTNLLAALPAELAGLAISRDPSGEAAFIERCGAVNLYHPLPDGRLLPLPGERLAPILKSLMQLIGPRAAGPSDGKIKLHRAAAAGFAAFVDGVGAEVAWAASAERLVDLGRSLRQGRGPKPVAPPASFKAELRPYQSDGLAWLDFLREMEFGGVLADDMGLGKTVQALAFLALEKAQGRLDKPALIVAPTSVLPNWQAEAERFAPELSVLPLRGSERKQAFSYIEKADVVLTTYPLLMRDCDVLLDRKFHAVILDEAQAIKNPKAAISGIAHRIDARHRLALTGTPLENNLGEVWSLFQFLSPGLLGDETAFRRNFRTPIEKHGDKAAQAFLSQRLKPFMLRRTKEEVAKELPPKTEIIEHVRLEGAQRDLYETVRSLMHQRVREEIAKKGLAKSHIVFLDALLKLRQICCDPRLLKMPQAQKVKRSAKLERLMEMLPEMVGEGRRVLVFSQFTSMLALIEAELRKVNIPFVTLTGDTKDRSSPVKAFQSGKAPLFLLSLKAGGTGLNLTAADTVIHYDPWWNPAVENQATDRAYRIGQDKPVFVYKLMVEEGIEAAIEILKSRKAALAEALFAGVSKSGLDLSEADISALFAPLDPPQVRRAA